VLIEIKVQCDGWRRPPHRGAFAQKPPSAKYNGGLIQRSNANHPRSEPLGEIACNRQAGVVGPSSARLTMTVL